MSHAHYIRYLFDPDVLKLKTRQVGDAIMRHGHIEHIVATGTSGLAIAGAVSVYTGLPLTVVRKDVENSHSEHLVESCFDAPYPPYVFVDDLLATCRTLKRVRGAMRDWPDLIVLYSEDKEVDGFWYKNETREIPAIFTYKFE